jgi:hypothetical protein
MSSKRKITVTKESLEKEIEHSYKYLDKFGKHSDRLGRQMIEIARIVVIKNTDRNLSDYKIEQLMSDVLYNVFKELSNKEVGKLGKECFRTQFEAGKIENCFSYFMQVAKRGLWEDIEFENRRREHEQEIAEALMNIQQDSIKLEAEENVIDVGNITENDYHGCWFD